MSEKEQLVRNPAPLRHIFFQIMLWSLGVAAAAGFIAMLAANYNVVGRVAATASATAIASGIMWRLEAVLDHEGKFIPRSTADPAGMDSMGSDRECHFDRWTR
jgi:hypothetical protein